MARRGVTDFETVQVDAWPAGHFGPDEETGQRLCRAVAFVKPRARRQRVGPSRSTA